MAEEEPTQTEEDEFYDSVELTAKELEINIGRYNNPYEEVASKLSGEALKVFTETFAKYCRIKKLKLYTRVIAGMSVMAVYSPEHDIEILHIYAPKK